MASRSPYEDVSGMPGSSQEDVSGMGDDAFGYGEEDDYTGVVDRGASVVTDSDDYSRQVRNIDLDFPEIVHRRGAPAYTSSPVYDSDIPQRPSSPVYSSPPPVYRSPRAPRYENVETQVHPMAGRPEFFTFPAICENCEDFVLPDVVDEKGNFVIEDIIEDFWSRLEAVDLPDPDYEKFVMDYFDYFEKVLPMRITKNESVLAYRYRLLQGIPNADRRFSMQSKAQLGFFKAQTDNRARALRHVSSIRRN